MFELFAVALYKLKLCPKNTKDFGFDQVFKNKTICKTYKYQ